MPPQNATAVEMEKNLTEPESTTTIQWTEAMNTEKIQAIFDAKGRAFGSRLDKTDDQNGEDWWDYVADLGVKILVKDEVHSVRRPEELKSLINGKANGKWVYVDDCDNFLLVDRGFAEKVLVLGLP